MYFWGEDLKEGLEAHGIMLLLGQTVNEGDACLCPTHTR